ncbi:MAG: zinc metallopeptidase [Clostridia bacterium]|nr:zinc metallopeptidase [Clostridia bacterium]MBN2883394.1 zinc metallopeptidase [Clostridia bacterium]
MFYYYWIMIPALLLSLYAQSRVTSAFGKYSKIRPQSGWTGRDTARKILDDNGMSDIDVLETAGNLTDNYNPSKGTVNLSKGVFASSSISAVGVAAHETGHALQHRDEYMPLKIRSFLVPVANIGSMAGPYIVIFGLIFSLEIFLQIGIVLFSAAVLFYLVTLPVELNASKRALEVLEREEILTRDELIPAKKVLNAAALTYMAAALSAILTLLRLVLLSRNRR